MQTPVNNAVPRLHGKASKPDACTISAVWVKGIAEMLEAAGLNIQALFSRAGMDAARLNDPHARYPTEQVDALWELAAFESGNPAIGVARPEVVKPAIFDVVAFPMMSCETLLAGLQRLPNYLRILSHAATIRLDEVPNGYRMTLDVFGGKRPVPRQRFEFDLVTILGFCRWITRQDVRPIEVSFAHAPPFDLMPYHAAFRCPVRFETASNGVLFSHRDLALALPTHNSLLAAVHDRYAGEYLDRLDNTGIRYKVRQLVMQHLSQGEPARGDVAALLCMSERTLHRRLQNEETSFHQIVDNTRRSLASQYLSRPHLSIEQVAYLLGFAEASAFCRACKRWFAMSPGQYRSRLNDP